MSESRVERMNTRLFLFCWSVLKKISPNLIMRGGRVERAGWYVFCVFNVLLKRAAWSGRKTGWIVRKLGKCPIYFYYYVSKKIILVYPYLSNKIKRGRGALDYRLEKAGKYLFGADIIDATHQLVKHDSIYGVIKFLKEKYPFFRPAAIRFLIRFYHYLLKNVMNRPLLPSNTDCIIHVCCWGYIYLDKVKNYLLPSLLANENLPALSQIHKVTLLIHCDAETKKILSLSPVIKTIQQFAAVTFLVIPHALFKSYRSSLRYPPFLFFKKLKAMNENLKYSLLGGLQIQALEIALNNKCYISFLMPDFVISNDFLTKAFANIQNKKMVLATGFRTDYQSVMTDLNQFFVSDGHTQLSISAPQLTELKVRHIHAAARRRVVSPSTINYDVCAQLLFETSHGFIVRTFHLHPILLDCKHYDYQFKTDYYPIDNTVLSQILENHVPYQQQIYICDDASKIIFMELSNTEMYAPLKTQATTFTYQEIVDKIRRMVAFVPHAYDTPLNRYFRDTRIRFESPTIFKAGDFIADDVFFSDLEKCLAQSHEK